MLQTSRFKASQLNEIISCQLSTGSVSSTGTVSHRLKSHFSAQMPSWAASRRVPGKIYERGTACWVMPSCMVVPLRETGSEDERSQIRSKSEACDMGIKMSPQGGQTTERHGTWDVLAEKPPSVTTVFAGHWMSSPQTAQPWAAELLQDLVTWGWDWMPKADLEKEASQRGEVWTQTI